MTHSAIARAVLGALLAAGISAQSASFTPFGKSCRADLTLSAQSAPILGQIFVVQYHGPYSPGFIGSRSFRHQPFLLTGASDRMAGNVPLPFLLPVSLTGGWQDCNLYVAPDVVFALPVVTGQPPTVPYPIPIPFDATLIGGTFFMQWVVGTAEYNSATGTLRLFMASSNAARCVIGL